MSGIYHNNTKIQLSKDFETDQNENIDQNIPRDPKQTIKSNDVNNEFNVKSGMANYKCKVVTVVSPLVYIAFSFWGRKKWAVKVESATLTRH